MTNHDHERALELIMRDGTEDIAVADAALAESAPGDVPACAAIRGGLRQDRTSAARVRGHRRLIAGSGNAEPSSCPRGWRSQE